VISEILPYAFAVGGVALALITYLIMRKRGSDEDKEILPVAPEEAPVLPIKGEKTVTAFDAQKSKNELRLLDVEQEILSYGIRRIYEAQAEGKLSDKEREMLARDYKKRMREIKNSIDENQSVVALHELESMQDNLIKLFNERFDEINQKIGGLRTNLDLKPKVKKPKVAKPATTADSEPAKEKKREKKPSKPQKTEAEERIDQIRGEVEKVLARLGQMETEA
jgi:hypothetical protein